MRKALLASVSAVVLSSSVVMAADMAVKAPALPAAAPAQPWTGLYAGPNAGYAWGKSNPFLTGDPNAPPLFLGPLLNAPPELKPQGFIGGGQVGYNAQQGQWLFGAEADFTGLDAKKDASLSPFFAFKGPKTVTWSSEYDWLFTARVKGGYLIAPSWLLYATGGVAVTHVKDSVLCAASTGTCGSARSGSSVTWSDSETLSGGTVGGGIETMFAPNWTARVEYLYAKFDNTTPSLAATTGGPFGAGNPIQPLFTFSHTLNLVRFAINYRFSP